MEYINDINIQSAVMHVLDSAGDEPILNEYELGLNENTYRYLDKHIERCLKDEELEYAKFNDEGNIITEVVQDYLGGKEPSLINTSKEIAKVLFRIMKSNTKIPSCNLITIHLLTDRGPMIGILKMDYVRNFTYKVDFVGNKTGIDLTQSIGLPAKNQKIKKAAFIKLIQEDNKYDLLVINKQEKGKSIKDEYGANYWIDNFLDCETIKTERDITKTFIGATEYWTRCYITKNAAEAEEIRSKIRTTLKEEEVINIDELADKLFDKESDKESFSNYIKRNDLEDEITIDKKYIEDKLKKIRIKTDNGIELCIDSEAYQDLSKFEIRRKEDGRINMVLKNIEYYIEK
ncbi:nucleoid-associated protein [Clostridium sp. DSM 100503]|uniref:nucleoid-associated protein n=1 Tax=Clostridium sp. DSM 100503 TaxID=2963282 RepID=UPI00214A857B|nr:nucleoid-associated protein [Clostridium sp. DSM 100503]MCR1952988.1 nucleoid-associated protein [Clostridium sp. DSM 100503]